MISFELAKELKEKGFPQKIPHDDSVCCAQEGLGCHCNEADFPTLSELIEACVDFFGELNHYQEDGRWKTESKNWVDDFGIGRIATGNTPEEAVARLWIALQDK